MQPRLNDISIVEIEVRSVYVCAHACGLREYSDSGRESHCGGHNIGRDCGRSRFRVEGSVLYTGYMIR